MTVADGNLLPSPSSSPLPWPDGGVVGTDGDLYFTVHALIVSPLLNQEEALNKGEFKIM